jgi:hypothetical protein
VTQALSLLTAQRSPRSTGVRPMIAPAELGEPLDAGQVRTEFFKDRVSREWVLEHVAPEQKWFMGKLAVWYRGHVEAWMPTYVAEQQARAQRRRKKPEASDQ